MTGTNVMTDGSNFILMMDVVDLQKLIEQTAACVLQACQEMPISQEEKPSIGAGGILAERMRWAHHGFVNALQSQVSLLYSCVEAALRSNMSARGILFRSEEFRQLVADALATYQDWKTRHCQQIEDEHGQGFGSQTEFYRKDWSDLNEQLLSMYNNE